MSTILLIERRLSVFGFIKKGIKSGMEMTIHDKKQRGIVVEERIHIVDKKPQERE